MVWEVVKGFEMADPWFEGVAWVDGGAWCEDGAWYEDGPPLLPLPAELAVLEPERNVWKLAFARRNCSLDAILDTESGKRRARMCSGGVMLLVPSLYGFLMVR